MLIKNTINDLLIRLKNGNQSFYKFIIVPYTKKNNNLLFVLYKEGYILSFKRLNNDKTKIIVYLKYYKDKPLIQKTKQISKPSKRVFCSTKILAKQKKLNNLIILSTTKGFMSSTNALILNLGGELLCQIN